ncbi:Cobalamin biosynthesis protein CbiG, partial [gut metagenome]
MKLAGIAFTERGARLLKGLLSRFQEEGRRRKEPFPFLRGGTEGLSVQKETLKDWTERQFRQADGIIFMGQQELQFEPVR